MKHLLTLLIFLSTVANTTAQKGFRSLAEFGIDLTTPIIWASGGSRGHNELEFIYRETQEDKDLRVKLLVSNFNFYGKTLIANTLVEQSIPERLEYQQTKYLPKNSYVSSIGLAKYLKENRLPVYAGADLNLGISRGTVLTEQQTITLTEDNRQTLSLQDNSLFVLGLTPVIGIKKNLTDRIVFGIEFGATFNTLIGKMEYNDAPGKKQSLKVRQFDPILDRLINDIVLMISI